jgi:hypothetical protein
MARAAKSASGSAIAIKSAIFLASFPVP